MVRQNNNLRNCFWSRSQGTKTETDIYDFHFCSLASTLLIEKLPIFLAGEISHLQWPFYYTAGQSDWSDLETHFNRCVSILLNNFITREPIILLVYLVT